MIDVILIAGMPNSGTTVLRVILGNHATVFAAGNLFNFPDRKYFAGYKQCSCGARVEVCEFWGDLRAATGGIADAARARSVYERIADKAGVAAVVDVAHDLDELRAALAVAGIRHKLIHVIRDPEAVIRSRLGWDVRRGRHPGTLAWELQRVTKLAWRWRRQVAATERIVRSLGPQRAITLRYEQLGAAPEQQISRMSAFLGRDFSPVARRIAAGQPLAIPPHFVRGNGKVLRQDQITLEFDRKPAGDEARWRGWLARAMTASLRPAW